MLADIQTDTQADKQTHRQTNWLQYPTPLPGRSNNNIQLYYESVMQFSEMVMIDN